MADTNALITIKECTLRVLNKLELPQTKYRRIFQFISDGYREINIYHTIRGLKQEWTAVNTTNNSIPMPSDMIDLIDIYVPVNGEKWSLTRDNKIITTLSGAGNTYDADRGEGIDLNRQGSFAYTTTGARNEDGYYALDQRNRRIILRNFSTDTDEVLLVYISSGLDLLATTNIPIQYYPLLEAYAVKEHYVTNPNLNVFWERRYRLELDKVKYLETHVSTEVFRDMLYRTYKQLIDR